MNTLITPETKQLLFDKGWRYELSESYDPELGGTRVNHSLGEQRWNEGKNLTYVDITITEVIMWLYEKHGIWIQPTICNDKTFRVGCIELKNHPLVEHIVRNKNEQLYFNSPTEAYEAAIEYTLNNLI